MSISKFFTTPLGSFVKHFLTAFLTVLIAENQKGIVCFDSQCLKSALIAATFAILPVILNWLNPNYKNYGETKKQD